jgi:hypothetical protein
MAGSYPIHRIFGNNQFNHSPIGKPLKGISVNQRGWRLDALNVVAAAGGGSRRSRRFNVQIAVHAEAD